MKIKIINTFTVLILNCCCSSIFFVNCFFNESCERDLDEIAKTQFNYIEVIITHKKGEKKPDKPIYKNDHYDLQTNSVKLSLSDQNIKRLFTNIIEQNQTFLKNNLIIGYDFCTFKECLNERIFTFRNVSLNLEILDLTANNIAFLANRQFYGLQNLKHLSLSMNKLLAYIESNAFEGLSKLKTLDLSQNTELTNIYPNAFFGLEQLCYLNMINTKITIINEKSFSHLKRLETLDLGISTSLKEIKDYGFFSLTNLIKLDLSIAIPLSIIGERSFYGLSNLKHLRFDQSKSLSIVSIKKILKHLDQLESLEMTMLDLESLGADSFINLNKLKKLNLYSNKLSNVKNSFKGLTSLEELNLNSNNLAILNAYSFFSLSQSKLKKLNLNSCKITAIKTGAFNGLDNLLELSLNSNNLVAIEPFTFNGLPNLTSLFITSMFTVDRIEPNSFYGLENLKSLDLYHLKISAINNFTFRHLNRLEWLRMAYFYELEIMPYGFQHFQNLKYMDFVYYQSVVLREKALFNLSSQHKRIETKFKLIQFFQATDIDIHNFCGLLKLRPTVKVKSFINFEFYTSSKLNIVNGTSFRNDPRFDNIKNPVCYLTLFFIKFELLFKFYDNNDVNRFFFECLDYELEENIFHEKECDNITLNNSFERN